MEICEDIRQTLGMKELHAQRKETIERLFGTAKENHGFRYTQMYGKARMQMKVGLAFVCMNLKKLAKIKEKRGLLGGRISRHFSISDTIYRIKENGSGNLIPEPSFFYEEFCVQNRKSVRVLCLYESSFDLNFCQFFQIHASKC